MLEFVKRLTKRDGIFYYCMILSSCMRRPNHDETTVVQEYTLSPPTAMILITTMHWGIPLYLGTFRRGGSTIKGISAIRPIPRWDGGQPIIHRKITTPTTIFDFG